MANVSQVEWVSCDDRLPEPFDPVLVRGGCAVWQGKEWLTCMEGEPRRPILWVVEHWAALPKPPPYSTAPKPEAIACALETLRCVVGNFDKAVQVSFDSEGVVRFFRLTPQDYYELQTNEQSRVLWYLTKGQPCT